jgi:hypothetical protein
MPRKKIAHSRTDVRAMWDLMQKMGLEPVSVKYHPDGTFRIMTKKAVETKYAAQGFTGTKPAGNYWDKLHDPA